MRESIYNWPLCASISRTGLELSLEQCAAINRFIGLPHGLNVAEYHGNRDNLLTFSATKPSENYQWHWDWAQDFLDGHGYGPRPILGEDEHQGGPTWRSVYRIANQQKERICHVV